MPKMLDMIREYSVPAAVMRTAAKGALALPAAEMLEILVFLSTHSLFGEQARMSLAAWDEASACEVCADRSVPPTVRDYYLAQKNWRIPVLRALLENPAVTEEHLMELAAAATKNVAALLVASPRVRPLRWVLKSAASNHKLTGTAEHAAILQLIGGPGIVQEQAPEPMPPHVVPADASDEEVELIEVTEYEKEHAIEIASEEGKKFELVGADDGETDELLELYKVATAAVEDPAKVEEPKRVAPPKVVEPERLSVIQKINRMTVGQRVQLAMKGTKDERFVLIRDGSKVVSLAVLESPKLSDSEMEMFAGMKNVQQTVLRGIAGKRKFMKNYGVIRSLTNNPRCPVDVALPMLPHLLTSDLQSLSKNKNVSDTIRKVALKMYKDKMESRRG